MQSNLFYLLFKLSIPCTRPQIVVQGLQSEINRVIPGLQLYFGIHMNFHDKYEGYFPQIDTFYGLMSARQVFPFEEPLAKPFILVAVF